jgi:hypothetical protein
MKLYVWQKPNEQLHMITIEVPAKQNYRYYAQYPYFGVRPYVTAINKPLDGFNRSYSRNINGGLEWGLRSAKTILFTDTSELKPTNFSVFPKKIRADFDAVRSTGMCDHFSVWMDAQGNYYYMVEPYSAPNNWRGVFEKAGFNAIEIPEAIAPYRKNVPPYTRSFLLRKIAPGYDLESFDLLIIGTRLEEKAAEVSQLIKVTGVKCTT